MSTTPHSVQSHPRKLLFSRHAISRPLLFSPRSVWLSILINSIRGFTNSFALTYATAASIERYRRANHG